MERVRRGKEREGEGTGKGRREKGRKEGGRKEGVVACHRRSQRNPAMSQASPRPHACTLHYAPYYAYTYTTHAMH